jgi:hypothetical protein
MPLNNRLQTPRGSRVPGTPRAAGHATERAMLDARRVEMQEMRTGGRAVQGPRDVHIVHDVCLDAVAAPLNLRRGVRNQHATSSTAGGDGSATPITAAPGDPIQTARRVSAHCDKWFEVLLRGRGKPRRPVRPHLGNQLRHLIPVELVPGIIGTDVLHLAEDVPIRLDVSGAA